MKKYFTVKAENIVENDANFYHIDQPLIEKRRLSIRRHGLHAKLKVTDHPADKNKWLLYGGHCNFIAGKLEGLTKFKVEYTHFQSKEKVVEALIIDNETRKLTMVDEVKEMKAWKELMEKPQGFRSDLKADGGSTNIVEIMKEKYDYAYPTILILLDILKKREGLLRLIDKKLLSIAGAGNVLKYLEEKSALTSTDTQMMKLIIEAVATIYPTLNERYESSDKRIQDIEDAFKVSAPKLGKVLDKMHADPITPENPTPIIVSDDIESDTKEMDATDKVIAPSAQQDTASSENNSISISDKGEPVNANNAKNADKTGEQGNTVEQNANGTIATPEAPADIKRQKVVEEKDVAAETEKQEIVTTVVSGVSQKQEPSSIKGSPVEPQVLYIRNSDGKYVEYTCKHDGCPFRICKI